MTMTDPAAHGGLTADEAKALAIRSMQIMSTGRAPTSTRSSTPTR
jgi:hypothetical protein